MRAFEGSFGRQSGKFGHQVYVGDGAHAGDEGVVLRHVAGLVANGADPGANVVAENTRSSLGRLVEAQKRVYQCRLAGSVRPQQSNRTGGKRALEVIKNSSAAQINCQAVDFDNRCHCRECMRIALPSKTGTWNGPPVPMNVSRLSPEKLPVDAT